MTCDEVQLELTTAQRPLSAEVEAHLGGCEACRAFEAEAVEVLGLAALPELSASERAKLAALPVTLHGAWRARERRRSGLRDFVRLALAAGIGALVASAVWSARPAKTVLVERHVPAAAVASASASGAEWIDDPNLSDDGVFGEVSWPSETEGELP